LERFAKSGAWIDAVLALIELELPAWKICRLLYEDSQWTCSISRYPNLAFFGDVAEGAHESLPLAMVRAFLDARLSSLSLPEPTRNVPETREVWGPVLWCDNFK
jgi:hypothetical protein